jgi:polar amino acid transport system substrate-binding protein
MPVISPRRRISRELASFLLSSWLSTASVWALSKIAKGVPSMSRLKGSFSALSSVGLVAALFFNATPAAAEAKCEPEKVATKYPSIAGKTLKIGQDGESPPYSFRDPKDFKKLIGLDADLARETFACAGVKIEFVTGGWSGLLPAVIAGQTDMMWDTLYYTPKRAEQADFVTYLTAATGALVAKGNPKSIKSLEDICGKRATVGLGTVEEATFRDLSKKCVTDGKKEIAIVTYPDMPGGTRLIQNDRADVMTTDLGMVNSFIKGNPEAFERGFMIVSDYKIAIGYTKGNKDLGQAILDGLTVLKENGKMKSIFEQYGVDFSLARANEILTK